MRTIAANPVNSLVLYVNAEKRSFVGRLKFAGVKRCAEAYGWSAAIVWDVQSRPLRLKEILRRRKPLGCIVECSDGSNGLSPEVFGKIPVVYLDPREALYGKRVARVVHDGELIARLAFRELSAGRPTAYAVVGYYQSAHWSSARVNAYAGCVASKGLTCWTFTAFGHGRREKLRVWLRQLPDNCAVFAVNDEVALEVSRLCRQIGRRIPSKMSLLGVDNYEKLCLRGTPKISSIQIDFELAGFKACEFIHRMRQGGLPILEDSFGPLMVVRRESTSGFGRHEPRIAAVVELIRREACNGIRVRDVVKVMSGSRRLSELRFREALGHSILEEIVTVRMTRVFQQLMDTSMSIEDVIRASGFATGAALRKAFMARTGLSLSAWRKHFGRKIP